MNELSRRFLDAVSEVILGKRHQIELAFCCLLARGHLLIEDIPGVGKTTLSHTLAKLLGLSHQRIQFTSDLLPADILGAMIYDEEKRGFRFHAGPIFHQVVLADEINRASPKTQSALLEAMEEYQVSIEGKTHSLPEPFFVIATQNPIHQTGTFPLPESQLDRFLMRISLGYPDPEAERALFRGRNRSELIPRLSPCMTPQQLLSLQQRVKEVHVADPLLEYVQSLLGYSRQSAEYALGLSPRAGLALLRAAQGWAFLQGRDCVYPEDVRTVLAPVTAHRLQTDVTVGDSEACVRPLLEYVAIP
ncbi:AAA family ATPase [Methylohalobius crimeensis]|uniref:AAA family ATPase n=1 Tax=Methylohalobius crimeensis TaxID=244365 RepID=UPI0003B4A443|nr:AAA family ATPase [Methylohalobius crimeensis]